VPGGSPVAAARRGSARARSGSGRPGRRPAGRAARASRRWPTTRSARMPPSLAESYLHDYYAFVGEYASNISSGALTSAGAVKDTMARFAEAGCHELVLFPCSPDLDQLRRLAEVTRG